MGLTTQNQEEIEQPQVPKDAALWKRAKRLAAKAGHKDDKEYAENIYTELVMEEGEEGGKNPEEPTKDDEINAVGADVPTMERPKARKIKNAPELVHRECIDRAAIIFLAKTLLTSTDLEDFKTLYPSLF